MLVFFCLICQQAEQSSVCFHIRFIQAMCSLKCLFEQLKNRNLFQLAERTTLVCLLLIQRGLFSPSIFSLSFLLCPPPIPLILPLFFFLQAKSCICHMCGAHLNRLHSCLYCVFFGCFTKKHIHEHAKNKRHNLGKLLFVSVLFYTRPVNKNVTKDVKDTIKYKNIKCYVTSGHNNLLLHPTRSHSQNSLHIHLCPCVLTQCYVSVYI